MTKDEAKEFLHKHMTVVGSSAAIEEPDTAFLTKYATVATAGDAIAVIGATGETGETGTTGETGETGKTGASGEEE